MLTRCVVGGCSNTRNIQKGIALHAPCGYMAMIVLKRRNRESDGSIWWRRNVQSESCLRSVICSKNFKPDDFAQRLDFEEENGILLTPWLKQDEFGITAFPSTRAAVAASEKQQSVRGAERDRRMVRYFAEQMFFALILYISFLSCSIVLNKKYFLQTVKASSTSVQSKMAKVCQCETPEAIPKTSGV